jgi:TusA-related sulfurtransferase
MMPFSPIICISKEMKEMNVGDAVTVAMWSRVEGTVLDIKDDVFDDGKVYLVKVRDDQVKFFPFEQIWMEEKHLCPLSVPWPPPERIESKVTCPSCGKEDIIGWCECGALMMRGDEDDISFSSHRIDVGDGVDVWSRSFCGGVVMSDEKHGFRLVRVKGASPDEIWYTVGSLEKIDSEDEESC